MPSKMFNSKSGFSISDKSNIIYGQDNPSVVGVPAPKSSVYLRDVDGADAEIWLKYTEDDNGWKDISSFDATRVATKTELNATNTQVSSNTDAISEKASQTDLDSTNTQVSANTTAISGLDTSKADQIDLDSTNTQVSSNTTAISGLDTSKADQIDLDATDIDVANNTDNITANTTAISGLDTSKADQIDLDATNSRVTQTENGIISNSSSITNLQNDKADKVSLHTTNANVTQNALDIATKISQVDLDATNVNVDKNALDISTKAEQVDLDATNVNVSQNTTLISGKADQSSLDSTNTQVGLNKSDISTKAEQVDLDSTNVNVSQNTNNINNVSNSVDANTTAISDLDSTKAEQVDLDTTNTQVGSNTSNIVINATAISGLDTSKADQTDLDATNVNVSQNTTDISQNTTDISDLQTSKANQNSLNTTNANVSQNALDISDLQTSKANQNDVDLISSDVSSNTSAISSLNTDKADQVDLDSTNTQVGQNVGNIENLQNTKADQVDLDSTDSNVSSNTSAISSLNTDKADQVDLDSTDSNVSSNTSAIASLETSKANQTSLNTTNTNVSSNTTAISDLDSTKAEQVDLDSTNTQVGQNTTDIASLDSNKAEQSDLVLTNNQVGQNTTQVGQNTTAISSLDSTKAEQVDLDSTNTQVGQNTTAISDLDSTKAEQVDLDSTNTQVGQNTTDIANLTSSKANKTDLDATNSNVSSNADEIVTNATDIIDLYSIKADRSVVDALSDKVLINSNLIEDNTTSINIINGLVATNISDIADLKLADGSGGSQADIDDINARIDINITDITQNTTDISGKADQSSLNTTNSNVSANTSAISSKASQTDLDSTNSNVTQNTTDISQHTTAIATLNTDKANQSDLVLTNSQVLTNIGNIDNLQTSKADQTDLDTTNSNVTQNTTNISNNTGAIVGNATLISNLQNNKIDWSTLNEVVLTSTDDLDNFSDYNLTRYKCVSGDIPINSPLDKNGTMIIVSNYSNIRPTQVYYAYETNSVYMRSQLSSSGWGDWVKQADQTDLDLKADKSTTINSFPLSSDVVLDFNNVGAINSTAITLDDNHDLNDYISTGLYRYSSASLPTNVPNGDSHTIRIFAYNSVYTIQIATSISGVVSKRAKVGATTWTNWVEDADANDIIFQSDGSKVTLKDPTDTLELDNSGVALSIKGDFNIEGNIVQSGSSYETHLEEVFTTDDKITMRQGAVSGLGVGEKSGILVSKYDGVNNSVIGIDASGIFRVGDEGDEFPIAIRDEKELMADGNLVKWDLSSQKFVDSGSSVDDLTTEGVFIATDTKYVVDWTQPLDLRALEPSFGSEFWKQVGQYSFVMDSSVSSGNPTGYTGNYACNIIVANAYSDSVSTIKLECVRYTSDTKTAICECVSSNGTIPSANWRYYAEQSDVDLKADQTDLDSTNVNVSANTTAISGLDTSKADQTDLTSTNDQVLLNVNNISDLQTNKADQSSLNTTNSNVSANASDISSLQINKASQTELNATNSNVSSNTSAISSKASQTDLNTTNSNVSSNATAISGLDTSKADQTDLDLTDGQVLNNISSIGDLESNKADKTELDRVPFGKQYVVPDNNGVDEWFHLCDVDASSLNGVNLSIMSNEIGEEDDTGNSRHTKTLNLCVFVSVNGFLQTEHYLIGNNYDDDINPNVRIYQNDTTNKASLYILCNTYYTTNFLINAVNYVTGDVVDIDWVKSTTEPSGTYKWNSIDNNSTKQIDVWNLKAHNIMPYYDGGLSIGSSSYRIQDIWHSSKNVKMFGSRANGQFFDNSAELTSVQGDLSSNTTAISGLQTSKADQSALNTTNSNVSSNTTAISGLDTSKADQTDLDTTNSNVSSNTTAISGLQTSKADQSSLNTTNSNVSSNTTAISGLDTSKADQTDLDLTNSQVLLNVNNIADLDSTKADQSSLNTTNSNVSANASAISSLSVNKADQTDLDTTNSNVSSNTTDIGTNTTAIASLNSDKADQTDLDTTNSNVSSNATAISGLDTSKADQSALNTTNSNVSANTSAISSLQTSKANQTDLTTTNSNVSSNATAISGLDTSKADQSSLNTTNSNVSANTSAISGLDTSKADQTDLTLTNDQVLLNVNNISTNTTAISGLQTSKADQSSLNTTNSNVSSNTTNISANTTNINKKVNRDPLLLTDADDLNDLSGYSEVYFRYSSDSKPLNVCPSVNSGVVREYTYSSVSKVQVAMTLGQVRYARFCINSVWGAWNIDVNGTRTINSKPLSTDIVLDNDDVGALRGQAINVAQTFDWSTTTNMTDLEGIFGVGFFLEVGKFQCPVDSVTSSGNPSTFTSNYVIELTLGNRVSTENQYLKIVAWDNNDNVWAYWSGTINNDVIPAIQWQYNVKTSRKINSKPLSSDIELNYLDVGALNDLPIQLTTSDDLDTTSGIDRDSRYFAYNGNAPANSPTSESFIMSVNTYNGSNVIQLVRDITGTNLYEYKRVLQAGVWSAWVRKVVQSDIDAKADVVDANMKSDGVFISHPTATSFDMTSPIDLTTLESKFGTEFWKKVGTYTLFNASTIGRPTNVSGTYTLRIIVGLYTTLSFIKFEAWDYTSQQVAWGIGNSNTSGIISSFTWKYNATTIDLATKLDKGAITLDSSNGDDIDTIFTEGRYGWYQLDSTSLGFPEGGDDCIMEVFNHETDIPFQHTITTQVVYQGNSIYTRLYNRNGFWGSWKSFASSTSVDSKASQYSLNTTNSNVSSNTTDIGTNTTAIASLNSDKADQTDLDTTNSNVSSNTSAISSKADQSSLNTTNSNVSSNTTAISGLQTSKADQTDLDTTNSNVSANTTAISSKASQTSLNTTNSNVSANTTAISNINTDISGKADQTDLDTTNSNVSSNTSAISSKASQSSLNTTNSNVSANTTAISGKASQTSLNSTNSDVSSNTSAITSLQNSVSTHTSNITFLGNIKADKTDLDSHDLQSVLDIGSTLTKVANINSSTTINISTTSGVLQLLSPQLNIGSLSTTSAINISTTSGGEVRFLNGDGDAIIIGGGEINGATIGNDVEFKSQRYSFLSAYGSFIHIQWYKSQKMVMIETTSWKPTTSPADGAILFTYSSAGNPNPFDLTEGVAYYFTPISTTTDGESIVHLIMDYTSGDDKTRIRNVSGALSSSRTYRTGNSHIHIFS